jgi:putative selenium metabolism hydrolase
MNMIDESALIEFAQALVGIPSPSSEEGPVVERIVAEMQSLGFDRAWVNGDGSAVGIIAGARPGPTLLLDGHCDTVGIAPGVPWVHDPFAGTIEDGYLYGRGTADMKGALAAMIHAVGRVDRTRLAGRVAVSATVNEENLEGAALKTVMDELRPDNVIIGEATNLALNRGGRGRAELHLETMGRPAHSSQPHLGRNAVHDMIAVIQVIEHLPVDVDPDVGPGIYALTDIISDPYPAYSVLPTRCRVTYDRRLLPGETLDEVLGRLRQGLPGLEGVDLAVRVAQGEHQTYTGAWLRGPKFLPAWLYRADDPYVQAAARGLDDAGLAPPLGSYRFCTNAAYSAGMAGIPTIGFGPGREEDAHVIDERIALADLLAASRGYNGIITAVLGTPGSH